MFKTLRIALLLLILVVVALNTLLDRTYTRDWRAPLQVALYPVNADGSAAAAQMIERLGPEELAELSEFFSREAKRYSLPLERPFRWVWAAPLRHGPPLPPSAGGMFAIMKWSLQLRWFNWRSADPPGPTPIIKLYVLYHDPTLTPVLAESTALSKGLVGIAHVFASADMRHANLVIIAHELLHTLTATDKYDLSTDQPLAPEGLADPEQDPLYPQRAAELMAGRIALSPTRAEQAESLRQVLIGPRTAREIGWVRP